MSNNRFKWSKKMDEDFRNGSYDPDDEPTPDNRPDYPAQDGRPDYPVIVRILTALSMVFVALFVFLPLILVVVLFLKAINWALGL